MAGLAGSGHFGYFEPDYDQAYSPIGRALRLHRFEASTTCTPNVYRKCRHFGLSFRALGHCLTRFWGGSREAVRVQRAFRVEGLSSG